MSGLFSTFSVAKRGMFVQQKTIDVTSHNIANANTEGYSRQRAIVETTRPFGMPSINSVAEPGQLGTGAQIAAIERVRDSFLDYQVRTETSTTGQYRAREQYLSEIESILNEPTDTGLSTLIGKFYDSWQELSKQPQSSNARTVVAQQSLALSNELNHTYNQLVKLKTNAASSINQTIVDVNSMLSQINELNQQIVQVKVAGKMPNDLMDKRDLLLDQLSEKFNINIDKRGLEGIDLSTLEGKEESAYNLVNAVITGNEKRFSYISSMTKGPADTSTPPKFDVTVTYYKLGDMSNLSNSNTLTIKGMTEKEYKELDQCRTLWANDEGVAIRENGNAIKNGDSLAYSDINIYQPVDGSLKGYMSIQTDVDKYIDEVNRLAKAIAFTVNAVHSGTEDASIDNTPFFTNYSLTKDAAESQQDYLARVEASITAGNITVNDAIVRDVTLINVGKGTMVRNSGESDSDYIDRLDDIVTTSTLPRKAGESDAEYVVRLERAVNKAINGETDNKRALAVAALRDALIKIQDISDTSTRADLITFDTADTSNMTIQYSVDGMKVDRYFKDTVNRLGVQSQEAKRMVTNQEALLYSFEESRLSVSGVSLDEEMANLVQYQHAYNANAKLISTIDELLDVVVNGLKR